MLRAILVFDSDRTYTQIDDETLHVYGSQCIGVDEYVDADWAFSDIPPHIMGEIIVQAAYGVDYDSNGNA